MRYEWGSDGVVRADGGEVASYRAGMLRARAEVRIGPCVWHYRRSGSVYVGTREPAGAQVFRARRRSLFSLAWDVSDGTHHVVLRPHGFSVAMAVTRDGVPVGQVRQARNWRAYRPSLEIDSAVPLEEVAFLLWVALEARGRSGD